MPGEHLFHVNCPLIFIIRLKKANIFVGVLKNIGKDNNTQNCNKNYLSPFK